MSSKGKAKLTLECDKRSKIEALKEKKAAAAASRAATSAGKPAANSLSKMGWGGSKCASRVTATVVVLSPPRKVKDSYVFEGALSTLETNEDVAGHARLTPLQNNSVFAMALEHFAVAVGPLVVNG